MNKFYYFKIVFACLQLSSLGNALKCIQGELSFQNGIADKNTAGIFDSVECPETNICHRFELRLLHIQGIGKNLNN